MGMKQLKVEAMTIEELRKLAGQGNIEAMIELGRNNFDCKREPIDDKEAREWLERAAALGNADAQYLMGVFSDKPQEKVEWYAQAAKQGHMSAMLDLATCYRKGKGVKKDSEEAANLYMQLADSGSSYAAVMLGKFYQKGEGLKKSDRLALSCFRQAAALGDYIALEQMEIYYRLGIGNVTANELVWLHRNRAKCGKVTSLRTLARFYEEGDLVERDVHEAIRYYKDFLSNDEQTDSMTHEQVKQVQLARCLEEGDGVPQNLEAALYLYHMAAGTDREIRRILRAIG